MLLFSYRFIWAWWIAPHVAAETILAIIPRYSATAQRNVFGRVRMPPVGPIQVISQIAHDPRYAPYAIDENNYAGPRDRDAMPDHAFLQQRNPAAAALFYGSMTNSIPRVYALAHQYRSWGVATIAGGSHVDALPEEALASGIDVVVHGEGDQTIRELLPRVLDGAPLDDVRGISYRNASGEVVRTTARGPIGCLDDLVQPDLTLIKYLERPWTAIPISRSRGCNHHCEFCVVNTQYGRFKAASAARAYEQVVRHADLGADFFFFADDNFTQDRASTIELLGELEEYQQRFNRRLRLFVQARSEIAEDDALLDAMQRGGVRHIAIGFESPINAELKAMRKGVTVEQMTRRARKLSERFSLHGMFIFGYPSEQTLNGPSLDERAAAYRRFFRSAGLDSVQVFNAVPLPGSDLRARLEREGRLLPKDVVGWERYDGSAVCYDPSPLDRHDLERMPQLLMRQRYIGRSRVLSALNYGNWANWAFNATIGFPIQFGLHYTHRFVHGVVQRRRAQSMDERSLPRQALTEAWGDIKRRWHRLAVKTYAGSMVRAFERVVRREQKGGSQR